MNCDYSLCIDGRDYQPIPESWIEHGTDSQSGSPRLYAVSAAVERPSKRVYIRYTHPSEESVLLVCVAGIEHGGGVVPCPLENPHAEWQRSLVPSKYDKPTDLLRDPEREHFHELWGDRLDSHARGPDENALVADGGAHE